MFKTILKIAVLSATAITLLSACGAAKKALGSAADDALNAALAKAEKRYEKRYTEAISNLKDDNGDLLKVYIDDDGTPFHVTIDENGDPIKVTIDDKINSIKAKTDDKGNPIQVTIDDKGNPIPVTIDYKSDPLLTVAADPATAEFCSGKNTLDLWESPCDNDAASIQRRHEHCLNNPFDTGCAGDDRYQDARTAEICSDKDTLDLWEHPCFNDVASIQRRHEYCLNNPFDWYFGFECSTDDRYNDARLKKCAVDFSSTCAFGGEKFYPALIQFCNNPANAGHDSCVVQSEPQVNSRGKFDNEFLQGTADGLNTGSLRASFTDATAPVVHTLKLSDSDGGVAFFGGIAPEGGYYRYYAGILPETNLGAPITQTSGTAVWHGIFSVITTATSYWDDRDVFDTDVSDTNVSDTFRSDTDFDLTIDFATKQLSASIGIENKDNSNDLDFDYRLSGVFTEGKIEGRLYATKFLDYLQPEDEVARVRGLIGQDGAVGVFITEGSRIDVNFSGGFVARPSSE